MTITFRLAAVSDTDSILEQMRAYYTFDHLVYDEGVARKAVSEVFTRPSVGDFFLVCDDALIVGYVFVAKTYSLEFHGDVAYVDELYFNDAYRGRGIARALMGFLRARYQKEDVAAMRLEVEEDNTRARSVYEKIGFKAHARALMTWWIR